MNIFFLDRNPVFAAKFMVDTHVNKMTLESAQLLSSAHRLNDGKEVVIIQDGKKTRRWVLEDSKRQETLYQVAHRHHPCNVWTRSNRRSYGWLYLHFIALGAEFERRFGKQHLSITKLGKILAREPDNISGIEWVDPPLAMPPEYHSDNAVESYRRYYSDGKQHLHAWTNRERPEWLK